MYEIRSQNIKLPIDSAIKKDGQWIGQYSGKTLIELQKIYPNAKVIKK